MMREKTRRYLEDFNFLDVLGFLAVTFGIWSVILAALGIFYTYLIWLFIICASILVFFFIRQKRKIVFNRELLVISAIAFLAVSVFSYFSVPSIFSGRDQGTFSESAIRLVQNHTLQYSTPLTQEFFSLYGPGKALNFPGFDYTQSGGLVSHFPVGYISWLAAFYSLFGFSGLILANAASLFLFLIFFFRLARRFLGFSFSFGAVLAVISSFIFSWFFKFTLGEMLAVFLLWFGIYNLVIFLENRKEINFIALISSLTLLFLVRIEAMAFILIIFGLLYYYQKKSWKELLKLKIIIGSLAFSGLLLLGSLWFEWPFYVNFGKTLLRPFLHSGLGGSGGFWREIAFVGNVFYIYALFNFFTLGFLGLIWAFKFEKNKQLLLPFWIILPTLVYLINPNISDDQPWMLRRFLFSIIPLFILFSVYFLDRFFRKKTYAYFLLGAIILLNLFVSLPYLPFEPHKNLLSQVEKISLNFSSKDLILVDRSASGDAWSMISGPLNFVYAKQAVYFFNPNDLTKISRQKFPHVFLIVPDDNLDWYQKNGLLSQMVPVKEYKLENPLLDPVFIEEENKLPVKEIRITHGRIYKWIRQ